MAEQGKKIVFEGVDKTSSASDSAKKGIVALHEANVKGLTTSNALLKEEIALLEKKKSLISQIAGQGLSGPQTQAVGRITEKLFATPERVNPEHIKDYAKVLSGMHLANDPKGLSDKIVQKLQELIENEKLQHRETLTHHLKDDEIKHGTSQGAKTFLQHAVEQSKRNERVDKENASSEKRNKFPEESIDTRSENKAMTVLMDAMHGNMIGAAGTAIEGAEEKLGKSMPWLAGLLTVATIMYEKEKEKRDIEANSSTGEEIRMSMLESRLQTPGELAINVAAEKRHRRELSAFQSGQFATFAATGRAIGTSFGMRGDELGITPAETAMQASQSSKERGRMVTQQELFGSQFANKVLGIDQGTIGSLERQSRFGAGGNVQKVTEQVITSMGLGNDRSKANEYLQMLVTLGQLHLNTLGKIDQKGDIAIMKAFTSGSGALFQNAETLSPIVQGINTGLASPQNSFAKAERFAAISKLHPGASFPQLMREMQKGIKSEGYLKETLNRIAKRGGGRDGMVMELVATGLVSNYEQAYELVDDYMSSHGTMFDKMTGADIAGSSTNSQLKNVVDRFDKVSAAKIQRAFAISPEKGLEVAQQEAALFEGRGHEEVSKTGTPQSKFAVATGAAADKLIAVSKRAQEASDALLKVKVSGDGFSKWMEDYKKANPIPKTKHK